MWEFIIIHPKFLNIIESNNYVDFDKMKDIYIKDLNLKPYLEEITIFSHVFKNPIKINENIIHIAMSLNSKYVYILLVSMTSILFNCNKNETFIKFHILCTPDVNDTTILKIKSLMKQFPENLELIFYNMGKNFISKKDNYRSQATYYRLILPIIINSDRIIYLDGDTLSFKDLKEMYNSNFDDNYVLGFLGFVSWGLDYLGIKANNWINAGVLLLNLKKIREDNKCNELLRSIKSKIKLNNDDNTVINYALYPKIGKLDAKYVIFNFLDRMDIKVYSKYLRQKINISKLEYAIKNPGIIHFVLCAPKPWYFKTKFIKKVTACKKRKNCSCRKFHYLWYIYAKKTEFYHEIINYYNN